MSKTYAIALLPGDGVGPEVTAVAQSVLETVGGKFGHKFAFDTQLIGGIAIDTTGEPLPDATRQSCLRSDAIFLGAVGGPKWDKAPKRPEEGLLALRKALNVFINIRPLKIFPSLIDASPLKPEIVRGVDLVVFRELIGGSYFGEKKLSATEASDLCVYSVPEIERITKAAFEAARGRRNKVTSVDKANVMHTGKLWRETVTRMQRDLYPDVTLEHALIDSMSMHLIRQPSQYDVILTENMFGDILSDEASAIAASIGLAPSASIGNGGPGLFEPVHGSAPDIAGKDKCNPIGSVLSVAMLLDYALGLKEEARAVEAAVDAALAGGARTADLGGTMGCRAMGDAILKALT